MQLKEKIEKGNKMKLDDTNYATWSVQMRSVLIHVDLWPMTCGKIVKPEQGNSKEIAAFESKDEKALVSILLFMEPVQLNHIKSCTTVSQAWCRLKEIHQPKETCSKDHAV